MRRGILVVILVAGGWIQAGWATCTQPSDDDASPLVCADDGTSSRAATTITDMDAITATSPSVLPCLARSQYSNGSVYNIGNSNGDLIATVNAGSSSDLANAFQSLIANGQCQRNTSHCTQVEGSYAISTQGFQRVFNVMDDNNQVLAVISAGTDAEAQARFAELVQAGVCGGN